MSSNSSVLPEQYMHNGRKAKMGTEQKDKTPRALVAGLVAAGNELRCAERHAQRCSPTQYHEARIKREECRQSVNTLRRQLQAEGDR